MSLERLGERSAGASMQEELSRAFSSLRASDILHLLVPFSSAYHLFFFFNLSLCDNCVSLFISKVYRGKLKKKTKESSELPAKRSDFFQRPVALYDKTIDIFTNRHEAHTHTKRKKTPVRKK